MDKIPWLVLEGIAYVLLVSTVAQFAFSSFGFNPTDDGFILAGSRRVLDGEIPHRDFISIRTCGSYYLHAPILAISDDHALWSSRYFAWAEFACISWIWTLISLKAFSLASTHRHRMVLAFVVFCFSSHVFPIMAWHSVDALMFASLGVYFVFVGSTNQRIAGYFLLGLAIAFRQNFVLALPVALLVSGDWRRISCWIACLSPMIFYVGCMCATGTLSDFVVQLTAYGAGTSFVTGIYRYLVAGAPIGLFFGYLAVAVVRRERNPGKSHRNLDFLGFVALLVLYGGPVLSILVLAFKGAFYVSLPSYMLFGASAGATVFYMKHEGMSSRTKCGVLCLTLAWCVSLSVGYNSPALASGALVLFLVLSAIPVKKSNELGTGMLQSILGFFGYRRGSPRNLRQITGTVLVVSLLVLTPVCWSYARVAYIYREPSMDKLVFDLGEVLEGSGFVRTDENTYRFLADLRNATQFVSSQGKEFVILPDCAAFWMGSSQRNPISCDWPQNTELGSEVLFERVTTELELLRGQVIVIVQKVEANSLAEGFVELSERYKIVQYVQSIYAPIGETEFFVIYE